MRILSTRRLKLYLQQNRQVAVVFLIGLVLIVFGGFIWEKHPRWSTVSISVGTSLIAASIVTYFSPTNREVFQRFLSLGISDVYLSRSGINNDQWVKWIRSARNQCTLYGISNNNWCRDPDFRPALLDLARREVVVRVFFLDPNSEVARQRAREENPATARDTIQTIKESVKFLWDLRVEMGEDLQKWLKLYVYNATPSFGATWVDNLMIATHYLAGFPNVTSPAVVIRPVQTTGGDRDLYGIYEENIRNVEKHHVTEIEEKNVANYIPATTKKD